MRTFAMFVRSNGAWTFKGLTQSEREVRDAYLAVQLDKERQGVDVRFRSVTLD